MEEIKALKPQRYGFKEGIITTMIDGGPGGARRRTGLTRYVGRPLVLPDLVNHLYSVLKDYGEVARQDYIMGD